MECRSALRLNALLFLFLISQFMYSTAFVSTAGKNYLQSRNRGMPQISFATSDFLKKPTMCASKSPLIQGMGSLSLGEAIASPMVVALHSGRFSAMQKAMCRIPGVTGSPIVSPIIILQAAHARIAIPLFVWLELLQ